MAQIYCGNNQMFPGLLSGTHVMGTNYECLRRGIGVGSHLPYDATFAGQYAPVDQRRFYCGNAAVLPAGGGHFAIGSPSKCLAIGVGIGKRQRSLLGPPAFMYFIRYVLPYILFIIISSVIFSVLYFTHPKFVTKLEKGKNIIDWNRLIPYAISFSLIVAFVIVWFWRYYVRRWI